MIKLKNILTILALVYLELPLFAQDYPYAYRDRINYIFANVDHSRIPTGLFSDYGLQLIP
jgi:hypothetical protein